MNLICQSNQPLANGNLKKVAAKFTRIVEKPGTKANTNTQKCTLLFKNSNCVACVNSRKILHTPLEPC